MREKLIELLDESEDYAVDLCIDIRCEDCPSRKYGAKCRRYIQADRLIANGVTLDNQVASNSKWISVKDRLPQENEPVGETCEQVQVLLDNGVVSTGWCNRHTKLWWHLNYGETHFIGYDYEHTPVVAWQPLAQPPKGE